MSARAIIFRHLRLTRLSPPSCGLSAMENFARRFLEEDRKDCNHWPSMPTPVGHAIAGLATGWFSDALVRTADRAAARLTIACVAAAVVPDVDILFRVHRNYTHSVGAAMIAGAVAWLVARRKSSA